MKKFVILAVVIIIGTVGALYVRTGSFGFVGQIKDKVTDLPNGQILEDALKTLVTNVVDEIKNPSPLVWKINSLRAHLTYEGTFDGTNAARARAASLLALKHNASLDRIAEERLKDMFDKQYFEHISPQGIGASTIALKDGYQYATIGENIALGNFENDTVLVQAWMDSPGHRANILNKNFEEMGIAVGKGVYEGKNTWIGVQIFAKPKSSCPDPSATLKNQIDVATLKLKNARVTIEELHAELEQEKSNPKVDVEAYNTKVTTYNGLVAAYSKDVQNLKKVITDYNAEVLRFNSCTQG